MLLFANGGASLITTRRGALKVMPGKEEIEMCIRDRAYVDALDFMVENAKADYTPADSLATAATESQELFTNGKTAMQLNWSHQYPAAVAVLGAVSYTHLIIRET